MWLQSVLTAAIGQEGRLGRPHSSTVMPIAAVGRKPASRLVEEGTGQIDSRGWDPDLRLYW